MLSRYGFNSIFDQMQAMANAMQRDIEYTLNRSFSQFDVLEHRMLRDVDDNSHVYMKIKTNDNGHVKIKTMQKEPGQAWKTQIEEYDRGNYALKSGEQDSFKGNKEVKPVEGQKESNKIQEEGQGQGSQRSTEKVEIEDVTKSQGKETVASS